MVNDESSEEVSNEESSYLWVYEPSDLDDMTIEQVEKIWQGREVLCGSKEAAAEALAIIDVIRGGVLSYQGWQDYINRSEIRELEIPFLSDDSGESYIRIVEDSSLTRQQVLELSNEELEMAWDRRPDSFSSIEAACQALSILRKNSGVVSSSVWQGLLNHPEIEKLKDELPNENADEDFREAEAGDPALHSLDLRTRSSRVSVVREGQQSFRSLILENYYGACCVSGSRIRDVLEAAHISPYTGLHSNKVENGLCLRVDIHRLFDKFLLSIDPESGLVKVSKSVKNDSAYTQLDGKKVTVGKIRSSKYLLRQHFRTFIKRQQS